MSGCGKVTTVGGGQPEGWRVETFLCGVHYSAEVNKVILVWKGESSCSFCLMFVALINVRVEAAALCFSLWLLQNEIWWTFCVQHHQQNNFMSSHRTSLFRPPPPKTDWAVKFPRLCSLTEAESREAVSRGGGALLRQEAGSRERGVLQQSDGDQGRGLCPHLT